MTTEMAFFSDAGLGSSVYLIVWFFLIYSFLGVVVETAFCLAVEGVLESRTGLLYLPLRPIYGIGGVAFVLFLQLSRDPVLVFLFGMLAASAIEYGAGVFVERVFGTVAWDYSDKRWNLNGRICLQFSICWGLLALVMDYVLDPFFSSVVTGEDRALGETILAVLVVATVLAGAITAAALIRIRKRVAALRAGLPDQSGTADDTTWDRVIDLLAPEPLIINSFPRTSLITQFLELTGAQRGWVRVWTRWPRPQRLGPRLPGRRRFTPHAAAWAHAHRRKARRDRDPADPGPGHRRSHARRKPRARYGASRL